jgi:hypothetical protein
MEKKNSKKSPQISERNPSLSTSKITEVGETTAQYLKDVKAVIVEQGVGKTRAAILAKQIARHGGVKMSNLSQDTTHILVGNSTKFAKLAGILKVKEISEGIKVVRADWLSGCLKEGRLVDCKPFSLKESDADKVHSNTENLTNKTQGKRTIDALDDLPCTNVKNIPSDEFSEIPTTSKERPVCKRRKVATEEGDSDYINSDDDTEEEGTGSGEGGIKPTEISPHISPHKKV